MRKPKPACPVCRRIGCTDPTHVRKPFDGARRHVQRPEYSSPVQVKRRAATVAAFMAEHGITLANGDVIARCPDCNRMRVRFVADHAVPLGLGGTEDGELRCHCRTCSSKQGAEIANRNMRKAT